MLCGRALWIFVLLGFCVFDHACCTREKAEGKMLVSLEHMHIKLMFCFPRSSQTALQAGTFIWVSQTEKERETEKSTW